MNNKLLIGAAAAAVGIYLLTKKKGASTNNENDKPIQGVSKIKNQDKVYYLEAKKEESNADNASYNALRAVDDLRGFAIFDKVLKDSDLEDISEARNEFLSTLGAALDKCATEYYRKYYPNPKSK